MNTHTYEIVDAALRHPHLIVDVWGPGWAGYNKSIPLSANIRKRAHRVSQLEKSKVEFEKKQRKKRENLAEGAEQEVWQRPDWLDVVPDKCSDVRYDVVLTISSVIVLYSANNKANNHTGISTRRPILIWTFWIVVRSWSSKFSIVVTVPFKLTFLISKATR